MLYDIAVIGGGPGGYTAAEHAAKQGCKVILFEADKLGGTCLNRGCMPTKALLHSTEAYQGAKAAATLGVQVGEISYDFAAMHERKAAVVSALRDGVAKLMKAGKIEVVSGRAQIQKEGVISCNGETYEAKDIIIATGTNVLMLPIPGHDLPGVVTSDDLLEGDAKNYKSLVVIGGGVVGVECATIYRELDAEVTLLEAADHILPHMDKEIAQRLGMVLKKQGIKAEAKAAVSRIEAGEGCLTVYYTDKKGNEVSVSGEGVLMAAGRRPNTEGLFAEGAEPELARGFVVADEEGRTSIPHVYTIGDVRAKTIQLAHVAEAQGKNVVDVILGKPQSIDMNVVPSCVYTNPEIASVGLTEEKAKEKGIAVKCGKYLTGANGKCLIEGTESGYVKLVTEADTGIILGGQMVCPRATDMIGELAVAVQKKLTASELADVIHPHPTFCEMISGCAEGLRK